MFDVEIWGCFGILERYWETIASSSDGGAMRPGALQRTVRLYGHIHTVADREKEVKGGH